MNSNADSISKADANKPDDKFFTSQDFLKFLEEQGISKMLVQTKDGKNISALFHSTDSMDPALFKSIESLGSLGDLTSDKNGSGEAKTFVEVSTFVSKEGEGTGGGGGGAGEERSSKHQDWMKSTEWVRDLRKDHVDVSYSQIFAKSTSGQDEQAAEKPSGAGTNAKNGQSLPPKKRTSSMMSASSEEDVLDSAKVGGAASSSAAAAANPSQILGMGATLPSGSAGKTDWNAMYQMAMYQNALQQTMLQRNVMQRNFVAMMGRQGMSNGGSANGNLQPGPGPNELSSNPAVTSAAAASASARTNPKTAPVALDSSALGLPAKGDAAGCTTSTAAPATAGSDGSAHGNTASLPLLVEAALRAQMAPVVEDTKKKVKKQASKSSASSDSKHRKPRKIIPDVKEYVDNFTDYDVLFGRGGRSNHHPGNKRYRAMVVELQAHYRKCDKHEKTRVAQNLVNRIKSENNSRFLELDPVNARWYVVPNLVARRKCGQALRENNTEEARRAKRAKYSGRVYGSKNRSAAAASTASSVASAASGDSSKA